MRKNILIIFALIMFSACRGRQTQAESAGAAVADSTEVLAPEETDLMASQLQSYRLTGTIGEDKASMVLDRNGNDVTIACLSMWKVLGRVTTSRLME